MIYNQTSLRYVFSPVGFFIIYILIVLLKGGSVWKLSEGFIVWDNSTNLYNSTFIHRNDSFSSTDCFRNMSDISGKYSLNSSTDTPLSVFQWKFASFTVIPTVIQTVLPTNQVVYDSLRPTYFNHKETAHGFQNVTRFSDGRQTHVTGPSNNQFSRPVKLSTYLLQKNMTHNLEKSRRPYRRVEYINNRTDYYATVENIRLQQQRFDIFLNYLFKSDSRTLYPKRVVQYIPHKESGFGNVVRGLMTTAFVAFMTDRSYRYRSEPSYFSSFFKPFPHIEDNSFSRGESLPCREYVMNEYFTRLIKRKEFDYIFRINHLCYITYSDITMKHISLPFYRSKMEKLGLIPHVDGEISPVWAGIHYRSLMYRLFLNPDYSLCTVINKHLTRIHKRFVIGVQIRAGGNISTFHERIFMGKHVSTVVLNMIASYMRQHHLKRKDVYLYLSSDSVIIIKQIKAVVRNTGEDFVYDMSDFRIGHTSTAKTLGEGLNIWYNYYHRALMDLFILKDSDYLIYSQGSSFGKLAYELQRTFDNSVSCDAFLKERGLNCSVYSHRSTPGDFSVISQASSKRFVSLNFNV